MAPRVLSIQSHVVHGYVGNKAATFPLQVLGFDVDAINSVQFSNHTGYSTVKGTKQTADELWELFCGLELNDLLSYTHVLTGYVGSADFLSTVVKIVRKLKEVNPDIVYVCDPVLGDHGKLYVPADLVPVFRTELIPLADIITPNQFELENILETKVETEDEAWASLQRCLDMGIKHAVLTSYHGQAKDRITLLGCALQAKDQAKDTAPIKYRLAVPRFDFYFTGTGDLLSALILARTWQSPDDPMGAVTKAAASLQGVCRRTYEHCRTVEAPTPRDQELRLIESKADFESPDVSLLAECERV